MKIKNKIFAVFATLVLIIAMATTFVACGFMQPTSKVELVSGQYFWGIDEPSMRDKNTPYTTIKVGITQSTAKDVKMYKDNLQAASFFNLFTDKKYTLQNHPYPDMINSVYTKDISALERDLTGKLKIDYLEFKEGMNTRARVFHCINETSVTTQYMWTNIFLNAKKITLPSNPVQKFAASSTVQSVDGISWKYLVIEGIAPIRVESGVEIFRAKEYGDMTTGTLEVRVPTGTTFYNNLRASLDKASKEEKSGEIHPERIRAGYSFNNQWWLTHQV